MTTDAHQQGQIQDDDALLRAKLNGETSRMAWSELQRFFASGALVAVSGDLDLVEVAVRIANDDMRAVSVWLQEGRLARVSDHQANAWLAADAVLWAVVVKPWVLVQDKSAHPAAALH